ncbi:CO/xanthine dehydrogenase Mo-binding subunit [Bradyrhizobium sp. USDA 4486]
MTRHRGRGMASINYPIGMNLGGDPSQALVHSNPSGKFTVALSSIDLGQGMKSVTRQICAETLGVPVEDVYVDTADSDTGPHCMGLVRLARHPPCRQRGDGCRPRGARRDDGGGRRGA